MVEPATTLAIVPPAISAAGTPLGAIQVRAVNSTGDADGNYEKLPPIMDPGVMIRRLVTKKSASPPEPAE